MAVNIIDIKAFLDTIIEIIIKPIDMINTTMVIKLNTVFGNIELGIIEMIIGAIAVLLIMKTIIGGKNE